MHQSKIDSSQAVALTREFIQELRVRSPKLFELGVQEGIIPGTYSVPVGLCCVRIITDMRGLRMK